MHKWLTPSNLYSRWNIDQFDLTEIVNGGKLQASFNDDFSALYIVDGGSYIETPDGNTSILRHTPLTVEDVANLIFRITDVEEFERINGITPNGLPTDLPQQILSDKRPLLQNSSPVNFFTRQEDKHWRVGFNGKECIIDPLDGVYYIAFLLERPGTSISCRDLYQALSGQTPDEIMSEGAAIDEGLNIGSSKQAVSSPETKAEFFRKFYKLENDLLRINDLPDNIRTPEDEMEKKEIEKEIAAIKPYLKERTFTDPDTKKAQSNISRRLDTAYEAISKANMNDLEKHLQTHIRPDGEFGLSYTGSLTWEITIR
jgi:hypothetical protein